MMTNINSKVKVKYLKYHLTIHFTSRLFHRKFAGNDVLSLIFCKRIAFMSTKQLWAAGNSKARQPSRKRKLFISCILFHCSSLGIVFELSFHLFEKPWVTGPWVRDFWTSLKTQKVWFIFGYRLHIIVYIQWNENDFAFYRSSTWHIHFDGNVRHLRNFQDFSVRSHAMEIFRKTIYSGRDLGTITPFTANGDQEHQVEAFNPNPFKGW